MAKQIKLGKTGRPRVRHYHISTRFAGEIRQALASGTYAPRFYGSNIERAEHEFFMHNIAIGIGSESANRYYAHRKVAYLAAFERRLAQLTPVAIASLNERVRRSRLSPESRQLEDLRDEVRQLRADLAARDVIVEA